VLSYREGVQGYPCNQSSVQPLSQMNLLIECYLAMSGCGVVMYG
jgi:hypothetical protein